jgi:hypothetical protein
MNGPWKQDFKYSAPAWTCEENDEEGRRKNCPREIVSSL